MNVNIIELTGLMLTAEQMRIRAELLLNDPKVRREFRHEVRKMHTQALSFHHYIKRLEIFDDATLADLYELSSQMGEQADEGLAVMFADSKI